MYYQQPLIMKYFAIIITAVFALNACTAPDSEREDMQAGQEVNTDPEEASLEGTWEMQFYQLYENDEVVDTVTMNEGYRQVKMYSDGHVMWSRQQPLDSTQMFGYGTYMIDGNTFSENMEYGSHYMMDILDSMRIFNWVLDIGEDYYVQTEVNADGERVYSETYRRIN